MKTAIVWLQKGLTIGDVTHTEAELRDPTVGDMLDATDESEKLVATPDGYQLLASPTLVGLNVLRRQVVRIGEHPGPLALREMKRLSPADLTLLQAEATALESATLQEVGTRGRDSQAPA